MEKVVLIIGHGNDCPPCDEIMNQLQAEIDSGEIEVLDVDSPEALTVLSEMVAEDADVEIPMAVVSRDGVARPCQIYSSGGVVLVKCGEAPEDIIVLKELAHERDVPYD